MAEPQPPNATEVEETQPAPASAEDRKAAAALDSLSANDAPAASKSDADQKALGEAMTRLEVMDKASKAGQIAKAAEKSTQKKEEVKKIKIKAEDVGVLVEELEVTKVRATEMLREAEGDAQRAVEGWFRRGIEVL
ncbi:MAG: hypothetical protein MMC23_008265 [Stictis urceolatum]|nr:hypothetical protein [Stictis urceolata]